MAADAAEVAGQLFGETQSRFLVSVAPIDRPRLAAIAERYQVPLRHLGITASDTIRIPGVLELSLPRARAAYAGALG